MIQTRVVPLFLAMLAVHFAHVLEEGWAVFLLVLVFGQPLFYIINTLLYCLVLMLFYFVLAERRWAYVVSAIYAAFMGFQGTAHTALTLVTRSYFYGFDGLMTGLPLLVVSVPLVYYLVKEVRGVPRTQR